MHLAAPRLVVLPLATQLLWRFAMVAALPSPIEAQFGHREPPGTGFRSLQVKHYTTEDGLAQNLVASVVQDRAGFIWVATRRGLQRFDGYSFVPYVALDSTGPAELSSVIQELFLDSGGRVWVGTPNAFFRIGPGFESTVRVPVERTLGSATLGSDDRLWFLDGGTVKWINVRDERPITHTMAGRRDWAEATVIDVSPAGIIWLAEPGHRHATVTRLDPARGDTAAYRVEGFVSPLGLRAEMVGRTWLSGPGLAVLEPGARGFRVLKGFHNYAVAGPRSDGRGGLLVATDDWLARIDSLGNVSEQWFSREAFGLDAIPTDIALDREGGVWLGTLTRGLFRLDVTPPAFTHRASRSTPALPFASDVIMALHERRDGTLWVGTLGTSRAGAYRIAADWSKVDTFRNDPRNAASLAPGDVWAFAEDRRGNLWVATSGGICRFDDPAFRCYHAPGGLGAVDISLASDGWFWLAANPFGAIAFDPATGRFSPEVTPSTPSAFAASYSLFAEPNSDALWIGAEGLFRTRVAAGAITAPVERVDGVGGRFQPVYDFHRDRHGDLWIGSADGLQRWDAGRRGFTPVPVPELRGSTVFSVAEDRTGRLWLGTAHGLVHYSPKTGTVRRYGRRDGFLGGELNRRAALLRRNGEMLVGGVNGLTQFDPEVVTGTRSAPPVVLTRWRKVTADGPVETPINDARTLRLEPRDRAFTIEFAALSYAQTLDRRYRYRLEGLNADWIESVEHVASYGAPRPGRYTFRVQAASGSEGQWSDPGAAITLDVIPPFWGTTWFKALVATLFLASLWLLHRLRMQRALATERLRLRIAHDLHDEIGAGLSSIALLSDSVGHDGNVTDRDRTQLQRIARSARDMVADLRDIVWAIDPDSDELEDVVARMRDVASTLLRGLNVSFHVPRGQALTSKIGMGARHDLLLLFKEVLHNVARHSQASTVRIELRATGDALELIVADDGVGFDSNGVASGTGLKSLRERATRLGGTLDLASEPGHGTTVRLTVSRT